MKLVELVTDEVWVNPTEVASVERVFDKTAFDGDKLLVFRYRRSSEKLLSGELEDASPETRKLHEKWVANTPEHLKGGDPSKDSYYYVSVTTTDGKSFNVKKSLREVIQRINSALNSESSWAQ